MRTDPEMATLRPEWEGVTAPSLATWLAAERSKQRNAAAALILAGAAIVRTDVALRDDLDPSIYTARRSFQENPSSASAPGGTGSLVVWSLAQETAVAPEVTEIAEVYRRLSKNMTQGGALDTAVKTLLEDRARPLRLGDAALDKLQVARVVAARDECFRTDLIATHSGLPRPGDGQIYQLQSAPADLTFSVKGFDCLQQNEDSDEIFLAGWFYRVSNLDEVYAQIENAIFTGSTAEFDLGIVWDVTPWCSSTYPNVTQQNPHRDIGHSFGSTRVKNGFCPWHFSAICIEDDDKEYDAVSDVLGEIQDAAEAVRVGANAVAMVSGPTLVGAAAGAVATAAAAVEVAMAIADAVVQIVNFFDDNDTIGAVMCEGRGDYLNVSPATVTTEEDSTGNKDIGRYRVAFEERMGNQVAEFNRAWRIETRRTLAVAVHKDPTGFWGGAGDESTKLSFSGQVDRLVAHGVDVVRPKAGERHAEWVAAPALQPGGKEVRGTVHWGVSWTNDINYAPWAEGWRILTSV
jgi:hypothetical protein